MNRDWSDSENDAIVEDYFNMLHSELKGQPYNKTKHRNILRRQLDDRSKGSVEFKHQNISFILFEMGIPFISGYKPRKNVQSTLSDAISKYLDQHRDLRLLISKISDAAPEVPTVSDILSVLEDRPKSLYKSSDSIPSDHRNPTGINFFEREAQNRKLGDAGEKFVIEFERERLIHEGKESLADKVEHVAVSEGPVAGFDILSFDKTGKDRYIEAKTTKYGKYAPFYVTPNELKFSENYSSQYYLYRLYKFGESPRMFLLQGDLNSQCILKPSAYIARSI